MICVVLLAAGADWEHAALEALTPEPGVVVLRRCVDVPDLMATSGTGQAQVALVGLDVPGLDGAVVRHLHELGVAVVAVTTDPAREDARVRSARIGVDALWGTDELGSAADRLRAVAPGGREPVGRDTPVGIRSQGAADAPDAADPEPSELAGSSPGRVFAVWGPHGAPGRTTLAAGLSWWLADFGRHTVLVDADPWAPSMTQHLGVVEETSGILAAARLAGTGRLEERFAGCCRRVGDRWDLLTGLPRPDRWSEVRPEAMGAVLDVARACGDVVIDTGASLEENADGGRLGRNSMTIESLRAADEVVVVGNADPVGLARLARGLVELRGVEVTNSVHVVVNRMRPTLGWSQRELAGMIEGFVTPRSLHFLPEDRTSADRAALAGHGVAQTSGSDLAEAIGHLAEALLGDDGPRPGRVGGRRRWRRVRPRTAGTAHHR